MILIGESSSTKTEWAILDGGEVVDRALSIGINPFFQTRREISRIIRLQLPSEFLKTKFDSVFFYGAGCTTEEKKSIVKASLESHFKAHAKIESDLLGAALSLFQDSTGIACILGTGSNSCFFDGSTIQYNVRSLGYILGDEGSGASLGKAFLSDCLKGVAPKMLIESFFEEYKIDPDNILDDVYTKPFPNRFLYSLSFFLVDNINHPYILNLVYRNLKLFFERNVLQYDCKNYPVRFVGNIASVYSELILHIADELSIKIDVIIENAIDGLIEYHKNNS